MVEAEESIFGSTPQQRCRFGPSMRFAGHQRTATSAAKSWFSKLP
jgi:hypothetical protein